MPCPGYISETIRCWKWIFGRDIGRGYRCATSWCDLELSVPRGTLVCIWEEFSRKGPPALPYPQVCLPIASLLVDVISSNLAHIFSSPGKIL